jgi:CRP-like cAMP-binding protein
MSKVPVLVTGGAGYIGSHAVLALKDAGWTVAVIDDLSNGSRDVVPADVPFFEGDIADRAFLVVEGKVKIVEHDVILEPGAIFGEMALFTRTGKRTATALCLTDVRLLTITYEQFEQLYFQNPKFGLYLVRLIVRRFEANHLNEELESS